MLDDSYVSDQLPACGRTSFVNRDINREDINHRRIGNGKNLMHSLLCAGYRGNRRQDGTPMLCVAMRRMTNGGRRAASGCFDLVKGAAIVLASENVAAM